MATRSYVRRLVFAAPIAIIAAVTGWLVSLALSPRAVPEPTTVVTA